MGWIAAQLSSWSAAQWTAGTAVIALLLALYGAILSTLNFLRAWPKLRLNARVDGGTILRIDVANNGGRPTTLMKIVIHHFENPRSWARNRATRTPLIVDRTLPFELQPGGVWERQHAYGPENDRGFVFRPLPLPLPQPQAGADASSG
jgi:hypothetical protein